MDCTSCKGQKTNVDPIPYIAHEAEMARNERTYAKNLDNHLKIIEYMFVSIIICVVLLAFCVGICYIQHKNCTEKIESINKYWIDYISGYDFEDYAVDIYTSGGGNANYIGNNGDVYNGTNNCEEKETY